MRTALRNLVQFIIDDARDRPWFLALESVSTLLGIMAATTLAIYNEDANFYFIWSAYCASSIGLAFVGYKRRSTNIMILMLVYTIINVVGLLNTIF